ncbi:MAG: hypothetical protein U1E89_16890 [Burkholderiaceae bacterium]
MMVTSLSFTYTQVSAPAGASAARQAAAEAPTQPVAQDGGCSCQSDAPRHSPWVRAVKDALNEMVRSGGTEQSASTKQADDAKRSNLDDALMNFARALMQTLRDQLGSRQGGDAQQGGGERQHHRHHHGQRVWGDAAQRVDALAQQVSAADASGASSAATTTAPAADATTIVVKLNVAQADQAQASPFQGLLDAFAKLQQALGKSDGGSDSALPKQLSEFLQALADTLRGAGAANADVTTRPGELISVAA